MVRDPAPTSADRAAALITAMMLRFPQDTLPRAGSQRLNPGEDSSTTALTLLPDGRRFEADQIVDWLQESPKPLVATPTYGGAPLQRGPAFKSPSVEHELEIQRKALADSAGELGLADDTSVLLDTGAEAAVFRFSDLRLWASTYAVAAGWQLRRTKTDPRARAQMVLIAPGPRFSPGWRTPDSRCRAA